MTVALMTLALASMATQALSRGPQGARQDGPLAARERMLSLSLSDDFEVRDHRVSEFASGSALRPFSLSPDAPFLADASPSLSIGPAAGYLQARGADKGAWFEGVQARIHFARILAAEPSITFHQNRYEDDDMDVRYIFLNPSNDQVIHRDFNHWQATLGLDFFF